MRLLLDSHALLWAVDEPSKLGPQAAAALANKANIVLVSAATVWELAIKCGRGKLTLAMPYRQWMTKAISDLGASLLPITVEYADVQATLPDHHRDPFDRLLAAQAQVENVPIVTHDAVFDQYGVSRVSGSLATFEVMPTAACVER
ncbi:MAG: type II toxin-antitoxin system VapC family toxin [Planctomycetia bacterium]|nr:type II toxin-antitoxin system VapC family toxin [Planctomycetia bacterium]